MKLSELGKEGGYKKEEVRYYLACIKEMGCMEFVGALCQQAYNRGLSDGDPESSKWVHWAKSHGDI